MIRRVYEVDPLVCAKCGGEMRIIGVILEHKVITKILGHLARKGITPGRDPPERSESPVRCLAQLRHGFNPRPCSAGSLIGPLEYTTIVQGSRF